MIFGSLALPEPVWDPANPEWPAVIPDVRHCRYLALDCFESDNFNDRITDRRLTDDEMHERRLDCQRKNGLRLFALPLAHMAYAQALELKARDFRCASVCTVTVDRVAARINSDGYWYAVRLAWLQTPSAPGYSFGSANWTPEIGRESAETLAALDALNAPTEHT